MYTFVYTKSISFYMFIIFLYLYPLYNTIPICQPSFAITRLEPSTQLRCMTSMSCIKNFMLFGDLRKGLAADGSNHAAVDPRSCCNRGEIFSLLLLMRMIMMIIEYDDKH